jgi:uncharacterized lipoprotein YajG
MLMRQRSHYIARLLDSSQQKELTMKKIIAIALLAASSLAAGCATRAVLVAPAPRVEVIGVAPYRGAVWVQGHYIRAHRDWVWVRGYWR